jgi:hypothetical protein
MGTLIDLRLELQAMGYVPVPCAGKRPSIPEWQNKTCSTRAEMATWSGANTGVLTAFVPVVDIDIMDPDAADLAELVAKEMFGDRGKIPVRVGQSPKRALPFCTMTPFPKMSASYESPSGVTHKIEVLCEGQQVVAFGSHDTGVPYTYSGCTLLEVPRAELAEVTKADMHAYLERTSECLAEEFGFKRVSVYTNGHGAGAGAFVHAGPVNVDARLAAMRFGGAGDSAIHPTQLAVTASMLRGGVSFDEVVRTVLEATEKVVAGDPRVAKWKWSKEWNALGRMCTDFMLKNPELTVCLSPELRHDFERKRDEGRAPYLVRRGDRGWCVCAGRGQGDRRLGQIRAAARRQAREQGEIGKEPGLERPHGPRFRLVPFTDLRPGPEPLYLVDELVPVAGLVDVWGKAKCFKSFWTLDLMLHVVMGWEYRDRYVRQGAVVYCAFEGAHGYKKRIEALRRHYSIAEDAAVPLYVMPGQANLIAEHQVLISDIVDQLGEIVPCAVVLDTLNKSLVGSENKDVDMGAYVRAAEAIRDRFGCVVIIVHHCGYDDTRPRGHSSLPGAVDAQLAVIRQEAVITVTVEMMRDGPEDTQVVSAVEVIEVGQDQNGKILTSLVVVPSDADAADGHSGWPRGLRVFYAALKSALTAKGEMFQPDPGTLPVRAVSQGEVRERFYKTYAEAEEDDKKRQYKLRKAFIRALGDAQSQGVILVRHLGNGQVMLWMPERGTF